MRCCPSQGEEETNDRTRPPRRDREAVATERVLMREGCVVDTDVLSLHADITDQEDHMVRPTYPITTARLRLRPFVPGDLDALYDIQSRDDVARYLYWGPRSRDEVHTALSERERFTTLEVDGDTLLLAIDLRASGVLIGDVNLHWLRGPHRQGEIGYVLHPTYHGQGYGREAAREMLRFGFEGLGLHRIIGRCDARNVASARLMERLGLRREAHFQQNEYVKGEWCDEDVYALLAAEWERRSP